MRSHFYLLDMRALRLSPPLFFGLLPYRMDGNLDGWTWDESLGDFDTVEEAEEVLQAQYQLEDVSAELEWVRDIRRTRQAQTMRKLRRDKMKYIVTGTIELNWLCCK